MAKRNNETGLLPKFEVLIIAVFFISFLVWVVPKCNRAVLPEETPIEETVATDTTANAITAADTTVNATPKPSTNPAPNYSKLYITIDKLNVRRSPELNADVLTQLSLFDQVYFLEEVTDSLYEINLGYEVAKEPWIKIRTQKGIDGWVYGAGVNYYKKKRSGVME